MTFSEIGGRGVSQKLHIFIFLGLIFLKTSLMKIKIEDIQLINKVSKYEAPGSNNPMAFSNRWNALWFAIAKKMHKITEDYICILNERIKISSIPASNILLDIKYHKLKVSQTFISFPYPDIVWTKISTHAEVKWRVAECNKAAIVVQIRYIRKGYVHLIAENWFPLYLVKLLDFSEI